MQDFLAEPVVDLLAEESFVVDYLGEQIEVSENDWKCVACGHALTAHTAGLMLHGRCLECNNCPQAVLTESAKRKVKNGLLP